MRAQAIAQSESPTMAVKTKLVVRSAVEACTELLRAEILAGTYDKGRGFVIDKISERLGISQTPIREAVRILEAEGFIEYHRGKGAVVRKLSVSEFDELIELRKTVEPIALKRAVTLITDETAALARQNLENWLGKRDPRESMEAQHQFLSGIYASSGLIRTVEAIDRTWLLLVRFHVHFWRFDLETHDVEARLGRRLFESYAAGDCDAATAALSELVDWGAVLVRENLRLDGGLQPSS